MEEQDALSNDTSSCPKAYKVSITKAIQTLDNLNDQIIRFIFDPYESVSSLTFRKFDLPRPSCHHQHQLKSSVIVIRRLLLDAQSRFRGMVDDNKKIISKLDPNSNSALSIQDKDNASDTNCDNYDGDSNSESLSVTKNSNADEKSQELKQLRMDLDIATKKLEDMQNKGSTSDTADSGIEEIQTGCIRDSVEQLQTEILRLQIENQSLVDQVEKLTHQVQEQINSVQAPGETELNMDLIQCHRELDMTKTALLSMREERKRLKSEKIELLNQIKQLYLTLEEKESEFREFIRNYEHRTQETDNSIKQMAAFKKETEQEKWELVKRARDASETAVLLKAQVDHQENMVNCLKAQIQELQDQLSSKHLNSPDIPTSGNITLKTLSSEELPPYETPPTSAKYTKEQYLNLQCTPILKSDVDEVSNFFNFLHTSTPDIVTGDANVKVNNLLNADNQKKKRRSFGSFSRVFTKNRPRRSLALPIEYDQQDAEPATPRISLLTSHNYQEKLNLVQALYAMPMSQWRANHVLAWLEIVLSMPMYGKKCSENIKSGKVLLELSEPELYTALGITNALHRRKLRLAIEEQRDSTSVDYQKASSLDHTWITHRWLNDLGLSQYANTVETQLIDGRVLNTLSKKDLEKYLSINRKLQQSSITQGVELLRLVEYDKDVLYQRRAACETTDTDLLVWTNQRVVKWVNSIDLGEYSENLRDTGVHGALMVLEASFTSDVLSALLRIPSNKPAVRKHLATELESLLTTARSELNTLSGDRKTSTFQKTPKNTEKAKELTRKHSFKDSIGRAFGRKVKDEMKVTENGCSSPQSQPRIVISGPISAPIHSKSFSLTPDTTTV